MLLRLDGNYAMLVHSFLCMCMSCSQVGSLAIIGSVWFGKFAVFYSMETEGNLMLKRISGYYLCPI